MKKEKERSPIKDSTSVFGSPPDVSSRMTSNIRKKPLLVTRTLEPSNMMAVENVPNERVFNY
jgi:hypothetical protein